MSKRILLALVVLVLVIGGVVVWFNRHSNKPLDNTNAPILSVSVFNQTQNIGATSNSARPGDVIIYRLTAENQTDKIVPGYVLEVDISRVTDKATLIDGQGASYNSSNNSLVWTPLDIPSLGSIQKQFSVRVNPVAFGSTNTVMKITFNNEANVSIVLPSATVAGASTPALPAASYKAPTTGPAGSVSVWLSLAVTGVFFGIKKYRISRI